MNRNRRVPNRLANVLTLIRVRSIFDSGLCERNRSDQTSYAELLAPTCKKDSAPTALTRASAQTGVKAKVDSDRTRAGMLLPDSVIACRGQNCMLLQSPRCSAILAQALGRLFLRQKVASERR